MTSAKISGHLPQCKKDPACERPASETVFDLAAANHIQVCRPHKREINRQNAQYIGHCQFDAHDGGCDNYPVTVRYVDGEDIAVCAKHDSFINQQYASNRTARAS